MIRLITLNPGHFHAALFQKQRLAGVADDVHIYAPLGPDLNAHLTRIAGFNNRADSPTDWKSRIYAGSDYLDRLVAERPGNVAIISGRNRGKIDAIQAMLDAGIHVLGDKPWILQPEEMPKLARVFETAREKGLTAFDAMTQRFEIASIVQRELVLDAEVFGAPAKGSKEAPSVYMDSVHYLMKTVAGSPLLRPGWFFDTLEQGEGLTDVGTHLVDLVQWKLSPDRPLDYKTDIQILGGSRWPTVLTLEQFRRVTGLAAFPEFLRPVLDGETLPYFCNNTVHYTINGIHVQLDVKWGYEAEPGSGDSELAIFRGERSRVEFRQGRAEKFRPEIFVVPNEGQNAAEIGAAVRRRVAAMQTEYPGIAVEDRGGEFQVTIPDAYRVGHEAHFTCVAEQFLSYIANPATMPSWETPFMLAKYHVTTAGVAAAH